MINTIGGGLGCLDMLGCCWSCCLEKDQRFCVTKNHHQTYHKCRNMTVFFWYVSSVFEFQMGSCSESFVKWFWIKSLENFKTITTVWCWWFCISLAPQLVGDYIIPGDHYRSPKDSQGRLPSSFPKRNSPKNSSQQNLHSLKPTVHPWK